MLLPFLAKNLHFLNSSTLLCLIKKHFRYKTIIFYRRRSGKVEYSSTPVLTKRVKIRKKENRSNSLFERFLDGALPKILASGHFDFHTSLFINVTIVRIGSSAQPFIAFSSRRNFSIPIYKMPFSSCHGIILSLTTTIFLNESPTRLSERISCSLLSLSATDIADWI